MGTTLRQLTTGLHAALVRNDRQRVLAVVALVVTFFAAFVGFISFLVIRGEAVTTGFYMGALDRSRAFDRVYSDLLADPEFTTAIEPFFGSLGLDRSYAVSTLRFIAPPQQLRQWTQSALDRATEYVRGDTSRYSGEVNFSKIFVNQKDALSTYVQKQMVESEKRTVDSPEALEREIDVFTRELSSGRVPSTVPVALLTPEVTERITNAILRSINPEVAAVVRAQVEAYVSMNDLVGALATVAPILLQPRIDQASASITQWFGENGNIDPAVAFADILGNDSDKVVARLDRFKGSADTYSPHWLPWASITVMALSLGGLLWLTRGGITRKLLAAGMLLFFSGGLIWLVAETAGSPIIDHVAGHPLAAAFEDRPEGWGLPESARVLVGDIKDEMYSGLSGRAAAAGMYMLFAGSGVALLAIAINQVPELTRGKHRWLLEKEVIPVLVVIALAAATLPLLLISLPGRSDETVVCNGHRELCGRRYDEVVFAATHNSMSNASEGWLLPFGDVPIRQQLNDGIRALLLDTHYWSKPENAVEYISQASGVPPKDLQIISNLVSRLGDPPPGPYLCHASCWLGADPLVGALRDIRIFLGQNPGAVVTLIIQDGVSVADTQKAFTDAGLLPFIYTHEPGDEWPTLGEMVESGQRLVVMAEFSGPPPDWYIHAWDVMQETPFDVSSVLDLDCSPGRGDEDNPLFLMNHWINRAAPDRVDASTLNKRDVIINRARECEKERGQLPNFIAVNFHRLGDVFGAVDTLNGVNDGDD